MSVNNGLLVAFSGFATVCFLLIGFYNIDQYEKNPLTIIVPILLGIVCLTYFIKKLKNL